MEEIGVTPDNGEIAELRFNIGELFSALLGGDNTLFSSGGFSAEDLATLLSQFGFTNGVVNVDVSPALQALLDSLGLNGLS